MNATVIITGIQTKQFIDFKYFNGESVSNAASDYRFVAFTNIALKWITMLLFCNFPLYIQLFSYLQNANSKQS